MFKDRNTAALYHEVYVYNRSSFKHYKNWQSICNDLMTHVSDADWQQVMLDSLIIKAHVCANSYEINGNEVHTLGQNVGGFLY